MEKLDQLLAAVQEEELSELIEVIRNALSDIKSDIKGMKDNQDRLESRITELAIKVDNIETGIGKINTQFNQKLQGVFAFN